ncbi:ABC transporter ATP-binding protein [Algisphaera agarilytica]|uniref:Oligopeptide/dipeptide ABC transporter ATP-binding protein n=1 Tax=Algisphaera agarilytica TaxID=1385975 RepID=A0A7X0H7C9_9BACT|nr:ABC transporter ATP-binding protein [Algisphaera agarilytica]MBB6430594.1 oligopeptide/dipeptide ABC transporter ATP-binding protein [Algisphaera agarilytica]
MDQPNTPDPLLQIQDLSVSFPAQGGQRLQAANGVNLSIFPKQTLAVVGESGSGKSVSAMSILQLIPTPPGKYDTGKILWRGGGEAERDLLAFNDKQMRQVRGNQIAMIFQEPMTSLNPVYTIGQQIMEAVLLHQTVDRGQAVAIAEQALRDVGIADPSSRLKEYPHQLSGGMRQRVMIAMALACQPELLLADEPTTALDVTIQAQILELLRKLQREKGMSILLITHDLGVVAENADVVAVMFAGRIVEYGSVQAIFNNPMHPYTRGLLRSMPVLGRKVDRLDTVMDGATIPEDFPEGFVVQPHDPEFKPVAGGEKYGGNDAQLHEIQPEHWVLCAAVSDAAKAKATRPELAYRRASDTIAATS